MQLWIKFISSHLNSVKYNTVLVSIHSFIESIFFPIPVDPLLITLSLKHPKKAIFYSVATALSSVVGGAVGYFLGFWIWDFLSPLVFEYLASEEAINKAIVQLKDHTFYITFTAALTPLPFKVFTVAAGVAHSSFAVFILAAFIGRIARYVPVGVCIHFFGDRVKVLVGRYFYWFSFSVGVVLVLWAILYFLRVDSI